MAEIELKPCPFCSGEAYFAKVGLVHYTYFVECYDCECVLGITDPFETKEQAAAAWNQRKKPITMADRAKEEYTARLETENIDLRALVRDFVDYLSRGGKDIKTAFALINRAGDLRVWAR